MRPKSKFLAGMAALAGTLPVPATAEPLKPTSPWRVDYSESQCVALRQYGTDAKPLLLILKPSPEGTSMRVLVAQNGSAEPQQIRESIRFGNSPVRNEDMLLFGDSKTKLRSIAMTIPMAEFRQDAAAADIAVNGWAVSADLAIVQGPEVVAELDKCIASLKDYWRIDAAAEPGAREAEPMKPLHAYFSPGDYPEEAARHDDQGTVKMTFLVDETGTVRDCSVEGSSGVPTLDTMSCYIIQQRARFKPAVGPDGKPRRSAFTQQVTWRMAS